MALVRHSKQLHCDRYIYIAWWWCAEDADYKMALRLQEQEYLADPSSAAHPAQPEVIMLYILMW